MNRQLIPWTNRLPATFEDLRREMDEALSNWFSEGGNGTHAFAPSLNLAETDKQYEVTMDLPGLKPADVDVELQGDQLLIRGQREEEQEEKGKTYHRIERRHGAFRRMIPLPLPVDAGRIEAKFTNGVLRVVVPKAESAAGRRIEVRS